MIMFELHLAHTNIFTKKKNCKKGLVGLGGLSSLKIIFALSTEIVIVHMQFTIIHIQHFNFKESFVLY